jgi:hypothetical protein
VWLLKVVRELKEDPDEVRRLQAYRDATVEQLDRAKEYTQRMRERGELRLQSPGRRVSPAMEQFARERFAQGKTGVDHALRVSFSWTERW